MKKLFSAMVGLAALALTSCATYFSEHYQGALKGNAKDQWAIATCYRDGDGGVPGGKVDMEEALKWFRKSAEQGYGNALDDLGMLYMEGKGVPENLETAARYFEMAAQRGNKYGQSHLGDAYISLAYGDGGYAEGEESHVHFARCHEKAAYWYSKAAAQGLADAQYELARCYESAAENNLSAARHGVYINLGGDYKSLQAYWLQAEKWYKAAAPQGSKYKEAYERFKRTGSAFFSNSGSVYGRGHEYMKLVARFL